MDTILYDALNNSLGAVFASVARAGLVLAAGAFIGCAVLFVAFAWPRTQDATRTPETQPEAPDGDDIPTADGEPRTVSDGTWYLVNASALSAMPPSVAMVTAARIAEVEAMLTARREGNGHE